MLSQVKLNGCRTAYLYCTHVHPFCIAYRALSSVSFHVTNSSFRCNSLTRTDEVSTFWSGSRSLLGPPSAGSDLFRRSPELKRAGQRFRGRLGPQCVASSTNEGSIGHLRPLLQKAKRRRKFPTTLCQMKTGSTSVIGPTME